MSEKNVSYYQFQKKLGYQVYLQLDDFEFESQLAETFEMMGFDKVERDEVRKTSFKRGETKVLKIQKANSRVAQKINKRDYVLDKFGEESLAPMGQYSVYRYRGVGMFVFSESTGMWELGLNFGEEKKDALRVILTRFLSFSLSRQGIVGFWGVAVDEGFVVMKPKQAQFESIFIDLKKNVLITYDGVKELEGELNILRLNDALVGEAKVMKKESLLSFLSMNTTYMAFSGFELGIKDALYELSHVGKGLNYPEQNFVPREANLQES